MNRRTWKALRCIWGNKMRGLTGETGRCGKTKNFLRKYLKLKRHSSLPPLNNSTSETPPSSHITFPLNPTCSPSHPRSAVSLDISLSLSFFLSIIHSFSFSFFLSLLDLTFSSCTCLLKLSIHSSRRPSPQAPQTISLSMWCTV